MEEDFRFRSSGLLSSPFGVSGEGYYRNNGVLPVVPEWTPGVTSWTVDGVGVETSWVPGSDTKPGVRLKMGNGHSGTPRASEVGCVETEGLRFEGPRRGGPRRFYRRPVHATLPLQRSDGVVP